ncbi:hypothetical protein BJF83_24895 [Nocardiopsis sp. CNR-923]|nr:hypothetical protein BJF83_24895 [Nocardiopsis sp. CNR-923]
MSQAAIIAVTGVSSCAGAVPGRLVAIAIAVALRIGVIIVTTVIGKLLGVCAAGPGLPTLVLPFRAGLGLVVPVKGTIVRVTATGLTPPIGGIVCDIGSGSGGRIIRLARRTCRGARVLNGSGRPRAAGVAVSVARCSVAEILCGGVRHCERGLVLRPGRSVRYGFDATARGGVRCAGVPAPGVEFVQDRVRPSQLLGVAVLQ